MQGGWHRGRSATLNQEPVNVDATASHQGPNSATTAHYHSGSAGDTEESESDEDEVVEDDAVDASAHEVSVVKAKDWRLVADFEDPLALQHPNHVR
jgi:hypothetical protein